mmetsp:Transcript_39361/g.117789  ORF Transcript_39361/g.117789 Transcript_39361/m.117789 type:complete len:226 (+) Transcript_39361:494-1171(+)
MPQAGEVLGPSAAEVGEPGPGVVHNMVQHVSFVVVHLRKGRLEELPLAILLVCAVRGGASVRQRPDGTELVSEARDGQQVQDRHHSALVSREHGEDSLLLGVAVLEDVLEELPELLNSAARQKGRLKVVGDEVCLAPLRRVGAVGRPAQLRSAGLVRGHERCQRQRLVEVEDHELHRVLGGPAVQVPLQAPDLQRLLAHPGVLHKSLQCLVVRVVVCSDPAHVLH